ncbi:MAG: response regulator, partial [Candidatus Heimdallarchaeota archaeon]|nr:response regulator [Candidatus Heimdallarchaeota archaeon]MCK5049512.1 response regulator [Candidatus Heimdallarchaeota archaeon]
MAFRLLVIDDEQDILRAISRVFYRESDIELIIANDAEEGLVKVRTIPIDVIICDQRMPGITGIELFHILKEEYSLIPLILLTGHATMDLAIRAINEVGIFGFINKPWRKDQLISMVRKAIDKRAQLKRDEDRKKYERLLEGRIWETDELREQLTIFFAEWDEYLGPVLRSYYPNRLNLDFNELATHIFVSSVSVYGNTGEYETSQVTMPIKYVDLEARLTYDAVDDETVRGGKRLQIIVVLLPEISVQTAIRIDEIVEQFQKKRNLADEVIIQTLHSELVDHIAAPKEIERRPIRFDFTRENALDDLVKVTFPKAQAGEIVSSTQIEVMIIQASEETKSGKTSESQAILVPLLLQTIEQNDRPLIL